MWAIYKTRHIFRVKSAVDSWAVTKPLNWRRYTSESIKGIREMAFVTKMPIHCEETWTTLLYVPKRASLSLPRILAGSTVAKQLHSPRQNVLERRRCAKSRAWCHPQGWFFFCCSWSSQVLRGSTTAQLGCCSLSEATRAALLPQPHAPVTSLPLPSGPAGGEGNKQTQLLHYALSLDSLSKVIKYLLSFILEYICI